MIDATRATSIYAKLVAGETITPAERAELDEYAARFVTPITEGE